jgi:hypothetical protein
VVLDQNQCNAELVSDVSCKIDNEEKIILKQIKKMNGPVNNKKDSASAK